jgi:uncharacterized integral membrane protein
MNEPTGSKAGRRFDLSPRVIAGIVIGILALVFVLQNTGQTHIHLLFATIDNPAWLWLLILFVAGFVVGSIFPWFHRRRKRNQDSPS